MVSGDEQAITAPSGQNVSLFTSPLFHVSGCHSTLVVGLLAGLRLIMIEGRFDPDAALRLIEDEGVTIWATVPTMVWRVCEHPARHDYDTSTVRTVAFGGSPSADELQRMVRETFPNVKSAANAYGLTETSSVATLLAPEDAIERPDSVGRPVPTVRIRIADDFGRELPVGETGEVLITGPTLMAGYWGKPEATAEAIHDGWLHTGDIGRVDADRLPLHHRPQEGHDHPRRREHLLRRDREPPRGPPRDPRRRRHRRAPSRARRGGQGRRAGHRRLRARRGRRARPGSPRRSPGSRSPPTSSCAPTSCRATPAGSC